MLGKNGLPAITFPRLQLEEMIDPDERFRSVKSHTIQVSPINDIRVVGDTSRACPENTANPLVVSPNMAK